MNRRPDHGTVLKNAMRPAFGIGQKVRTNPSTAAYRRGDKDGEVVKVGAVKVMVRLESGIVAWFKADQLAK